MHSTGADMAVELTPDPLLFQKVLHGSHARRKALLEEYSKAAPCSGNLLLEASA